MTTASAVSSTIKSVVKIEGLNVRRKFIRRLSCNPQTNGSRYGESKWWFIISGEESLLDQLSKDWAAVKVQTNWSLEPVLVYSDVSQLHNSVAFSTQSENVEKPGIPPPISENPGPSSSPDYFHSVNPSSTPSPTDHTAATGIDLPHQAQQSVSPSSPPSTAADLQST